MSVSVFDLFTIGIGPSASHTVGPMRASRAFTLSLAEEGVLGRVARVRAELFGSLGATGRGHGSDGAVLLGWEGESPEAVEPDRVPERVANIRARGEVLLLGAHPVPYDLVLHSRRTLP